LQDIKSNETVGEIKDENLIFNRDEEVNRNNKRRSIPEMSEKATSPTPTTSGKISKETECNSWKNIVFYGDNNEVFRLGCNDFNVMVQQKKRTQSMAGFHEHYVDIVDYIIRCTHSIWEERGIGNIYTHYHNNAQLWCPAHIEGIETVISGTLQTLHAFPDRKLVGQNVIWSGNDKDGFYTSHRISSTATNLGDSSFGPATGKKLRFRTVADCKVFANRIYEEWLVRDNLYIVQQLGYDPVEVAKRFARESAAKNKTALQENFGIGEAREGQYEPELYKRRFDKFEIGDFILEMYNKVYEWRLFNHVKTFYAENAVVHYICDKDLVGYTQIQGMLISLFASFGNARFIVERVTCNQRDNANDWDMAVRWRILGIHEGIGYFGKPSGRPVEILGISHLRVLDEQIIEEWITFDGLDVLKQIHRQDGDNEELI